MRLKRLSVVAVAAILTLSACTATPGTGGAKTVKLGLSFPLSGSGLASAGPSRDGALLAIKEANAANAVPGYTIEPVVMDHAINGVHDPQQGAKDAQSLVQDAAVVGVIGPFNSSVAAVQIPITNEAGLLQCSPANTAEGLTKPEFGALDVRKANPERINYVRVATTDDIQGPAVARFGREELGLESVFIIDDTETYGKGIADNFEREWETLGGTVVGREGAPKGTTDYLGILATAEGADSVFYGGVTGTGGGLVRKQMPQAGLGDLPFLGGDGIQDQDGSVDGSFINIAGDASANSFSSVAAIAEIPDAAAFAEKYTVEYKTDPGAYSANGYACAQIVIEALKTAAGQGDITRENVRAAAVNPATTFQTVLGPVVFDANGDTSQKIISLYEVDPAAADGAGGWVFTEQIDYAGG